MSKNDETPKLVFVEDVNGTELLTHTLELENFLCHVKSDAGTERHLQVFMSEHGFDVKYGLSAEVADDPKALTANPNLIIKDEIQYIHAEDNEQALSIYNVGNGRVIELESQKKDLQANGTYGVVTKSIGLIRVHNDMGNMVSIEGDYHKVLELYSGLAEAIMDGSSDK